MKINFSHLWKVLSLLVPIPEGYAVGLAIQSELQWHLSVVVISAAIVALTGFLAIDVTNRMSEYNSALTEDEKQFTAPTWRGLIVLSIWFAGVVLLTVFLKVTPILATWTPLGLVVVGSSAAWLRSINKGQDTREQALSVLRTMQAEEFRKAREAELARKEEVRKERQASRNARKVEQQKLASVKQAISATLQVSASKKGALASEKTAHFVGSPDGSTTRSTRKSSVSDEELIVEYKLDPTITSTALAVRFNVSRQAIDQRRDALAKSGLLNVVRDGNGRVARVDVILTDASTMGQGS